MGVKCEKCGIAEELESGQKWVCLKYKKNLNSSEIDQEHDCSFFMPIRYESGEALSAFEHLLIREQEVSGKKMKGPI